jgi:amino acid adenylation domain-containing protein
MDILPLSPLQEGFLFHSEYGDEPNVYVVQTVVDIDELHDRTRLRAAAESVVRRHETLRASFRYKGLSRPVQIIHPDVPLDWREVDLSQLSSEEADAAFAGLLVADRSEGFDLAVAPLLRFTLVRLAQRHRLLLSSHHIIMDGWSVPIVLREIVEAEPTEELALPGDRSPYRAYLGWLGRADRAAARAAWAQFLADAPATATFAAPGTRDESEFPEVLDFELSEEATAAVSAAARGCSLTLSSVLSGLWACLLRRLNGQDDVIFGIVVSGRPAEIDGIENAVGLFINAIPMRASCSGRESARQVAEQIQRSYLSLLGHDHLSLAEIQEAAGRRELFDTLLLVENQPVAGMSGLRVIDATHYPLCVVVTPGRTLRIRLEYQPSMVTRAAAQSIGLRFARLIESFAVSPDLPLDGVGLLRPHERALELQRGAPQAASAPVATFAGIFADRVATSPGVPAVIAGGQHYSYGRLNADANRLARYLLTVGAAPERPVALLLRRSYEQFVALVATVKTGAPYLPIDPDLPASRIEYILTDARPVVVVTTDCLAQALPPSAERMLLDKTDVSEYRDDDLDDAERRSPLLANAAYVIYTSGSTGTPKGVTVTHAGLAGLGAALRTGCRLTEGTRILQFASMSFDSSVEDIVAAWLAGATLLLLTEPVQGQDLVDVLQSGSVNYVELPPSVLSTLPYAQLPQLTSLNAGGEACPPALVDRWAAGRAMVNSYGPTEATVSCTMSAPLRPGDRPVIGRAIGEAVLYLLDSALEPVPEEVAGELYIGGSGVARGYLNRPGLTSARFLADPFSEPGARMYRTGDLARWDRAGNLDFIGRADQQVKLRGFRIELGEIEAALERQPGVRQAAVILRHDPPADARLVAYLVGHDAVGSKVIDVADLRAALGQMLPAYMVPSAFVVLDQLPLTISGKLNAHSLPTPDYHARAEGRAPRTASERKLCEIFAEVLGVRLVSVDDNFFALGGHSLLAIRLISRIRASLKDALTLPELLRSPTVADIAALLERDQQQAPIPRLARTVVTGE